MSPMKRRRNEGAPRSIEALYGITTKSGRNVSARGVEFGSGQEVVIAGKTKGHVLQPTRVNEDVVEIPEVDVRQIVREDALDRRESGPGHF